MRLLRASLLLLLVVLAAPRLAAQDALNMTLFDKLNPVDSVGAHSALWGYTAPDGREYAIFGSQIGTHVIDITSRPIRQVGYIWGPRNPWREMKVYGRYAYIVSESGDSGQGLQIVDLSDLPRSVRHVRTDTSIFTRAHTVFIRDHYLYAMGAHKGPTPIDGAVIADLDPDPLHPREVGRVGSYYFHDAWVRNDTLLGAAVYGQGCDIWTITDKAHPVYHATITYPFSGTHNAEMTSSGHYVMTTDEIRETPKSLKVWDVSDMEDIRKVADFSMRPNDIIHNVHVKDRYAFCSWYTAGVRVIDMIDPVHPREVGYYDTYPGRSGSFDGVWEVYPYFPSGKIIVSDRNTGLWVFRFNGAVGGSVSGVVREKGTNAPLAGVTIAVPQTGLTFTSDAQGRYYVGGVQGDVVNLATHQFGFQGTNEQVEMPGDVTHDIVLDRVPMLGYGIQANTEQGEELDSFAFAIAMVSPSATVPNPASVVLPRDSVFELTVGHWGYAQRRFPISAAQDGEGVVVPLHPRYEDSATLDLGWSLGDPADGARTGRWVRMIPYLSGPGADWAQPPGEPGGAGGYVFQTGAPVRGQGVLVNDVNNGTTTLTSPSMKLAAMPDPTVAFDLWFVHYEQDTVRDSLKVDLSNDDGMSWVTVYTERQGRPGWKHHVIPVRDHLSPTDRMRFRIRARDTLGNAIVMAAMDNFEVLTTRPEGTSGVATGAIATTISGVRGAVAVAPNPSAGHPTISITPEHRAAHLHVELVDDLGAVIGALYDGPAGGGRLDIAVERDLPAGWYLVRARDEEGRSYSGGMMIVR